MKESVPNVMNLKRTGEIQQCPHQFQLTDDQKLMDRGYTEFKVIGKGTYGTIYEAKWSKTGGQVGIKAIDVRRLTTAFIDKFLSAELEFVRRVPEHENIVKFHEIIEEKNDPFLYISMQLCPNGDFYEYMIRRQYIPEEESGFWFKQVVSGVQHIHRNGFAHRDLKCENLLLDQRYNIKITDFGMCCRLTYCDVQGVDDNKEEQKDVIASAEEMPSNTFCGSYSYASPELLQNTPYLPTKNDIWSVGIILYTMLFGRYPMDGQELERFKENDQYSIPTANHPHVSDECKLVISNILCIEYNRFTIDKIMDSTWFKREWQPAGSDHELRSYFENLNLPRLMTESFELTDNLSTANQYTSSVALIKTSSVDSNSGQTSDSSQT